MQLCLLTVLTGAPPVGDAPRGLSWDVRGGRLPKDGLILSFEGGYPSAPSLALLFSKGPDRMLGFRVAMAHGRNMPGVPDQKNALFLAVWREGVDAFAFAQVGLSAEAGLRVTNGTRYGLLLHLEASLSRVIEDRMIAGLALKLPMEFAQEEKSFGQIGVMAGPFLEYHLRPPLALSLGVQLGPIYDGLDKLQLGLEAKAGVAYRF